MPAARFSDAAAKTRTTETIRRIETLTSAEIVVALRPRSSFYIGFSLLIALGAAAIALCVMWFSPRVYDIRTMPLDMGLVFLVTLVLVHVSNVPKRLLVPKRQRRASVESTAKKAFSDLGIQKTRDRTGVLVFVSLLERELVLIPDEGIPITLLGDDYTQAEATLREAVAAKDLDAFLRALEALGPVLAEVLPRQPDDTNELCDDVA